MITLCYGLPGMGKTTWLHDFIRAHPGHRFFVVDRAAEWGADAAHWRGQPPPVQVFERQDAHPEPKDWPETGVYVFRGREPEYVAQLVLLVGNASYVDDELDFSARRRGWDDSPLRTIVHQGRHAEDGEGNFTQVNILGACRRPQSLVTDVTDIADQVCVFRVQGSRTLERLKADSMIEDEDWDAIRSLPKWHFKHWPSGKWLQVQPLPEQKEGEEPPQKNRAQGLAQKTGFQQF